MGFFTVSFTVPYRFYRFKGHCPYRFYRPSINQKPLSVQNDTGHFWTSAGACRQAQYSERFGKNSHLIVKAYSNDQTAFSVQHTTHSSQK